MAKKVLVASGQFCTVLNEPLSREGYDIVTASDGHETLQTVESEDPDLVILDITVAIISGWEVIRKLKANPETAVIPIIVILQRDASDIDYHRAWDTGSDCILEDPIDIFELLIFTKRIFDSQGADYKKRFKKS